MVAGCRAGGASVHGTGGHPGYAAEQLGMTLAFLLDRPQTFHLAESGDITQGPSDMWLGLDTFGFGRELSFMGPGHPFLPAADIGYGDPLGNVAHAMHGVGPDDLRIESKMEGLPAARETGTAAVLARTAEITGIAQGELRFEYDLDVVEGKSVHAIRRGYAGKTFVLTQVCRYIGAENAVRGDDLPIGGFTASHCYTVEVHSGRTSLHSQIQVTAPAGNTVAQLVARAALDAVRPVVHSPSGVLRYETTPGFVTDERVR